MAAYIKFFFLLTVAVACVLAFPAEENQREKKQVLYGAYGYAAPAYAAASPLAYSAYSAPVAAYSPYSAYPYAGYRSVYY